LRARAIATLNWLHAPRHQALLGATRTAQITYAVDMMRFMLDYFDNECYDIAALSLGTNFLSSAAPAAGRSVRLAAGGAGAGAPARQNRPLAQGQLVIVGHDEPRALLANAEGRLPEALQPSALQVSAMLGGVTFEIPGAMAQTFDQWTQTFSRPLDLSRFIIPSGSSTNVEFTAVPGAGGTLAVKFKYRAGMMPGEAETFEVRMTDGLGRNHTWPLKLALPDLPTQGALQTMGMNSAGQVFGQLPAYGAKGFRVVSAPQWGSLSIEPGAGGMFTYSGSLSRVVPDTFTVVAYNDRGDSTPVDYTVAGMRMVIDTVNKRLDSALTAKTGTNWYIVTITGRAASDVDAGYLNAESIPNNGFAPDRPVQNSCDSWTGSYTYSAGGSSVRYCMRAAGDAEWTNFSTSFYINEFLLAEHPVPYAGINFSFRDTSYCAIYANSLKCSTSSATAAPL
jgi:hypothetical protein